MAQSEGNDDKSKSNVKRNHVIIYKRCLSKNWTSKAEIQENHHFCHQFPINIPKNDQLYLIVILNDYEKIIPQSMQIKQKI